MTSYKMVIDLCRLFESWQSINVYQTIGSGSFWKVDSRNSQKRKFLFAFAWTVTTMRIMRYFMGMAIKYWTDSSTVCDLPVHHGMRAWVYTSLTQRSIRATTYSKGSQTIEGKLSYGGYLHHLFFVCRFQQRWVSLPWTTIALTSIAPESSV